MTTLETVLSGVLALQVIGGGFLAARTNIRQQRMRLYTVNYTHLRELIWQKGRRAGRSDTIKVETFIVVKGSNDDLRRGMVKRAHQHPGIEDAIKDIIDNEIEFYLLKS